MPILGASASGAKSSPVAPTIGTATDVGTGRAYNNGAATVTFTAPTSKLPITSYTVTSSPGGFTGTGASSPITVTGLQSATAYTFTVTATSAVGTSSASSASNSITATTVPQAPTIGSATAGSGSATVAYTAGATGGAAVSTFTATSSPGSITGTGASPITVSGLTAGTAYTFTVTATNANGTSTASSASNSVTPVSYFVDFIPWSATSGNNFVRGIVANSSGDIYAAGPATTTNLTSGLLKLNSSGSLQWSKKLGTSGGATYGLWNGVAIDSSGNVYTAGYHVQPNNEAYDSTVAKYDSSGNLQWQKSFGTSGATYAADSSWGIVTDSSNNVYVSFDSQYGGPTSAQYCSLIKFNSSGTQQFQKKTNKEGNYFGPMGIDSSSNIYTCDFNGWATKWASDGTITWQRQISFGGWWGGKADSSGNFYIGGSTGVIKLSTSGSITWQQSLTGFFARYATVDSSGNVYVVGYHSNNPNQRGVIAKFDSSGSLQWQRQIYQTSIDNPINSVNIDPVSGALLVGISGKNNAGNLVWMIAKLPVDGSKTGTISASGYPSLTYEASSLTWTTMTATLSTPTNTVSNGGLSVVASSYADASLGLSATTTTI